MLRSFPPIAILRIHVSRFASAIIVIRKYTYE